MAWPSGGDERQRLLDLLSQEFGVRPERIRATAAWRSLSGAADSLDIVEFVMALEEEHRGAALGRRAQYSVGWPPTG